MAARESILSESPRRSHGLMFDDRTVHEDTFAHGVSKRSSVAQGVDVTSGHFTAPSGVPARERTTRRGRGRGRGRLLLESSEESPSSNSNMADTTGGLETTGAGAGAVPPSGQTVSVPETSVTSVPDTTMSTVLELQTHEGSREALVRESFWA